MPLDNYRDISVGGSDIDAGFQFEFFCQSCDRRWKTTFVPHRLGRMAGLLERFSFVLGSDTAAKASGNFADMRAEGIKEKTLAEAMKRADSMYVECRKCRKAVCTDCFDSGEEACVACVSRARSDGDGGAYGGQATAACPSCQAPSSGGRFCSECGFDMASTHKSCPGCGVSTPRAARFCGDCGHAF